MVSHWCHTKPGKPQKNIPHSPRQFCMTQAFWYYIGTHSILMLLHCYSFLMQTALNPEILYSNNSLNSSKYLELPLSTCYLSHCSENTSKIHSRWIPLAASPQGYHTRFTPNCLQPFQAHFLLVVLAVLPLVSTIISLEERYTRKCYILSLSMFLPHPPKTLPLHLSISVQAFLSVTRLLLCSPNPTLITLLSSPK